MALTLLFPWCLGYGAASGNFSVEVGYFVPFSYLTLLVLWNRNYLHRGSGAGDQEQLRDTELAIVSPIVRLRGRSSATHDAEEMMLTEIATKVGRDPHSDP